jgi:ribose 5-phosphate isomerase A
MAARYVARRFAAGVCGTRGDAILRLRDGKPLITDNGQHILDVRGLHIADPLAFEREVSQWPGVVTVGVFALQKAAVCLLGTQTGVETLKF